MTQSHQQQPLAERIKALGKPLGFQHIGISHVEIPQAERDLFAWLQHGYHGDMDYMAKHGQKRTRPSVLRPGTLSVICARMNYRTDENHTLQTLLGQADKAYISRYALGRDYHKVIRKRLVLLAKKIERLTGPFGYRAFADSAPVMEKPLAALAGLGWQGKHTNLLHRSHGSWFFLGELYTDLQLPADEPVADHCGRCTACIAACPTGAIVAPYRLDARLCISYLTIEYRGVVPEHLRAAIGNRIYGCDDCQLFCPWNRFAPLTEEADFASRQPFADARLLDLFHWSEQTFLENTAGMALRRINHEQWLRNIAIALGNAPYHVDIVAALMAKKMHVSAMVREHIEWAIERQHAKSTCI